MTNEPSAFSRDRQPTRTERIVSRVRLELEEHTGKGLTPATAQAMHSVLAREDLIREALTMVRTYAESLNNKATQVSVTRMIIAITAVTLGKLNIPYSLVHELDQFATDINTLVYSPNTPLR